MMVQIFINFAKCSSRCAHNSHSIVTVKIAQMLAHSMMHTLESMVLLVQTSLPSDAMGMSHSCSTAGIP